jgi:hypothetical protein
MQKTMTQHGLTKDKDEMFLLRLVLMNPFIVAKGIKENLCAEFVQELLQF